MITHRSGMRCALPDRGVFSIDNNKEALGGIGAGQSGIRMYVNHAATNIMC